MRIVTWAIRIVLFLLLAAFAAKNVEPVALRFYFDLSLQAPLIVLLLAFFAAGALFGVLALLGTLLRHTVSPFLGRALWPMWLKLIFAPDEVPAYFSKNFPGWMSVRPETLRAVAEESLFTLPATVQLASRLNQLTVPTVVVAGAKDRYVSARGQSERVHTKLPSARLLISQRSGHMVHHSDLPLVLQAIDWAAAENPAG